MKSKIITIFHATFQKTSAVSSHTATKITENNHLINELYIFTNGQRWDHGTRNPNWKLSWIWLLFQPNPVSITLRFEHTYTHSYKPNRKLNKFYPFNRMKNVEQKNEKEIMKTSKWPLLCAHDRLFFQIHRFLILDFNWNFSACAMLIITWNLQTDKIKCIFFRVKKTYKQLGNWMWSISLIICWWLSISNF